ncbi:uncharacterized protein LAJ45_01793 [Morchella importuna]|uniref:Localizes primarily to the nucleolus n=1 Tax=Morchella conica CCBAS932 TaxID=1392247 RepID=A0A3N4L5H7_9PEZI|nr:uncharacterized protein LAJ45_01793 [Morchella importuna]KAH8154026.1 hypothetical protein LAJ45_01793 [Morchella importuna]RPB16752.1 hypothetical protein P167DRAFT_531708 [Morchella conica CCBAS932]
MAALLETLTTLITSLTSASTSLTSSEFPPVTTPENGISLLDVKNELLLSYLHNLVFLVLIKLRSGSLDPTKKNGQVGSEVVKELVKIRLLLEKGVKPLEAKLKYQIDKVVAAAVDEELSKAGNVALMPTAAATSGAGATGEESDDGVEHDDYGVYSKKTTVVAAPASTIANKELSFRPNPMALAKPSTAALPGVGETEGKEGIYKPPRISATVMPGFATAASEKIDGKRERENAGRNKSHMLDEFIADEMSTAPMATPSIGSTIVAGGRVTKSARERREEHERREYEENNFVRLPQLSKKELRERKRNGGDNGGQFGGEDWRDFAGDLDRLTKGAEKGGKSSRVLENSRKRRGDDEGGRNGGKELGSLFNSKKKMMAKRRKT